MATILTKEKLVVEDMELSMDAEVVQDRGTLTPFNAAYLPYSVTESVADAIASRYTISESDTRFAQVAGNATTSFNVATALLATEAVPLSQLTSRLLTLSQAKVEMADVIVKGGGTTYIPITGTDPVNKTYADGLIADKFLGAVTTQFIAKNISGDDVTVTVTNGVITGVV